MRLIIAFMLGLAAAGSPLGADPLDALRTPGAILLMRHALAPGTGDPAEFRLGDCTTQRNLDERGRTQARAVGAALRAADIPIDRVWTSEWCRARETATLLGLGTPIEQPLLNSFFRDRSSGPAQTEALRRALAALPRLDRPILITHQVNITALTGVVPQSGEIVAIAHAPDGDITLLGRVMAAR
ncbi:MAG: histidine phosphatase family protein [Rhodobacteraceae bacterium]|nr:histidine phosphatase family protein [Paracoccaceae bacterium]